MEPANASASPICHRLRPTSEELKAAVFIRVLLSVVAASLLVGGTAVAQALAGQAVSAKDDAIPSLRNAPVVALTPIRVVDGTGGPAREDQTLLIQGGKIFALGGGNQIKVPENASRVDLAGRTVLPGLVMLHEHLFMVLGSKTGDNTGLSHPQHFSFPRLYLAYGVTTIRTAGTDFPYMDLNLKRRIDAGAVPGPEIHLTSPTFRVREMAR